MDSIDYTSPTISVAGTRMALVFEGDLCVINTFTRLGGTCVSRLRHARQTTKGDGLSHYVHSRAYRLYVQWVTGVARFR